MDATRRTRSSGSMVSNEPCPLKGLFLFHAGGHCDLWEEIASSSARVWCPLLVEQVMSASVSRIAAGMSIALANAIQYPSCARIMPVDSLNRLLAIEDQGQQGA